jgi:hypothetical protein
VFEMADTCEKHRHSSLIGSGDNLIVAHRPTRLDCAGCSRLRSRDEPIRKWEKRIAAHSTTLK